MKYLLYLSIFTFLFPISFSRIVTTADFPGDFFIPLTNESGNLITTFEYKTKAGLNFAYEHLIASGGIQDGPLIYLFAGGEFMVGRRGDFNMSLHSIYLKPILGIKEKFMLTGLIGLTHLNSDQKDSSSINEFFIIIKSHSTFFLSIFN